MGKIQTDPPPTKQANLESNICDMILLDWFFCIDLHAHKNYSPKKER